METTVLDWLAAVGSAAFRCVTVAFLLLNGAAVAALSSKDRCAGQPMDGACPAGNLLLVGTGVGVPLIAAASRLAISVVTPAKAGLMPGVDRMSSLVPSVDRSKRTESQRSAE